jgi:hypothetical protein
MATDLGGESFGYSVFLGVSIIFGGEGSTFLGGET